MIVYCAGMESYDETTGLPLGVFSTAEKALASFTLRPGEEWHDDGNGGWRTERGGAADWDYLVQPFEVDAP